MKTKIFLILCILNSSLWAQSVIYQNKFESCKLPSGWSSKILNGTYSFSVSQDNLSVFPDGSCLLEYNQTIRNDISRRRFQLQTQAYAIGGFDRYYLVYNMQYNRPVNSSFNLYMNYGTTNILVRSFTTEIRELTPQGITLSIPSSAQSVYFYFEYDFNGNDGGTKIYLDDFILSPDNSDCSRAISLVTEQSCLVGHMSGILPNIPSQMLCSGEYLGAAWYKYTPDFTGNIKIQCTASYNNALSVFEGACNSLTSIQCVNSDEIGFEGEDLILPVVAGKTYFIRTSRKVNDFGRETGTHCIALSKNPQAPAIPLHDICDNKIPIVVNTSCLSGVNRNALTGNRLPSLNQRSRADIWYEFKAASNKPHQIISHSNFADVIAVYEGSCNSMVEIKVEDLGYLLEWIPVSGKNYLVQVSGYFSTVEGDLCLEVREKSATNPTNDLCSSATKINLNAACVSTTFTTNNLSTVKPSCVVYHAPDVWYSFVAPAEKEVAIRIDAGFIYHYGVYSELCTSLIEKQCGKTPDPCKGFITVKDLVPGKTYYLQVMSATHPLNAIEGTICVQIDELSKTAAFDPLTLSLNTECLHGVLTKVNYSVQGGLAPIQYTGPSDKDIFLPGQKIEAFVEDAKACRSFAFTQASCNSPARCKGSNLSTLIQTECLKDAIGRQTGEVILHVAATGGTGAYYFYGTPDGSKLNHGDLYKVILIDSDSCYVVEEGKINCPPFDCAQSALKLSVDYVCVDTLLKAVLQVDVSGNLGQFQMKGNQTGDFLNQGDEYNVEVTDEAGCIRQISGKVKCSFDSCAYARPQLEVDYICLTPVPGQQVGKAILVVNGNSKAGGIQYIGNQPGDTLNHLEKYQVQLKDAFGCELEESGTIDCVISSTDDSNLEFVSAKPNPTNGFTDISFYYSESKKESPAYFSVIDFKSQLIHHQKFSVHSGVNQMRLDMSGWPAGIYAVRLSVEGKAHWFKILKI